MLDKRNKRLSRRITDQATELRKIKETKKLLLSITDQGTELS